MSFGPRRSKGLPLYHLRKRVIRASLPPGSAAALFLPVVEATLPDSEGGGQQPAAFRVVWTKCETCWSVLITPLRRESASLFQVGVRQVGGALPGVTSGTAEVKPVLRCDTGLL